jgi:hypothetical protein
VQELWEDLRRAIDESANEYFLGTVVFSGDPTSQTGGLPAVIDGQQRLATISLLLAAIRDVFVAEGKQERVEIIERFLLDRDTRSLELEPRLTLNEENAEYFELTQLPKSGAAQQLQPVGPSNKKIAAAAKLLADLVAGLIQRSGKNWANELVELQLYVRDRAKVVVLDVPDEANAYLIFETLNDRGLDLTIADLLKNYLFSRADKKIDSVKQNWDRALGALDIGDDDKLQTTFLRHYWSSRYGYTREKGLYRSIKQRVTSPAQALAFSAELVDAARQYSALRNPSHSFWSNYGTPTRANLDTLLLLDVTQSRPSPPCGNAALEPRSGPEDAPESGLLVGASDRRPGSGVRARPRRLSRRRRSRSGRGRSKTLRLSLRNFPPLFPTTPNSKRRSA